VVIGDVDPAGVETAETIKRDGGDALFVQTDVRDASDVKNLVAVAVKTYGGLHCAFNNAGVLPTGGLLADVEEAAFDQVVAVDLKGVFLSMKYEIQQMLQTGGGAIVNNASIGGLIAEPGISAYVAAKHGVIGLSKAAGMEYASRGIRINALAPGLVETAMTKPWFDDPNIRGAFLAKLADWPRRATGRDGRYGPVSLLRLRIIRCRSDFCDRWRLHRSLRSEPDRHLGR
jgi:NAD(P)-dependent dehydrogenase (short-subunit alcohol dehydrogenase family)